MYYSFCNYNISIHSSNYLSSEISNPIQADADHVYCQIMVDFVSKLDLPLKLPLVHLVQGIDIYWIDNIEYRAFMNYSEGVIDRLLIDHGKNKILQVLDNERNRCMDELDLFNSIGLEKTFSENGRFILHSSFVETNKGGILFTAPSGTGKSTQANLWERNRGCEIINGDRSGIWKSDNVWMCGGVPWCGTSGIMKNKTMPIRTIVILKQGLSNEVIHINMVSKIRKLLEQITINPWNSKMYQAAQESVIDLVQNVPVLLLSCKPDIGAVDTLEHELEKYEV